MSPCIRFFVIGEDKGKRKTYFEGSDEETLKDFVRYVLDSFNKYNDMIIIDWQDRKQVKLLDYAREHGIKGGEIKNE